MFNDRQLSEISADCFQCRRRNKRRSTLDTVDGLCDQHASVVSPTLGTTNGICVSTRIGGATSTAELLRHTLYVVIGSCSFGRVSNSEYLTVTTCLMADSAFWFVHNSELLRTINPRLPICVIGPVTLRAIGHVDLYCRPFATLYYRTCRVVLSVLLSIRNHSTTSNVWSLELQLFSSKWSCVLS